MLRIQSTEFNGGPLGQGGWRVASRKSFPDYFVVRVPQVENHWDRGIVGATWYG